MQLARTPCLGQGIAYIRSYVSLSTTLGAEPAAGSPGFRRIVTNSGGSSSQVPVCPSEPGPEDCCQSGCENCVWDVYREQLKQYTDYMHTHHPNVRIPAPKAVKQQIVDASMDAFEQLERQLQQQQKQQRQAQQEQQQEQQKQQQEQQQPKVDQQLQRHSRPTTPPGEGQLRAGNYVF